MLIYGIDVPLPELLLIFGITILVGIGFMAYLIKKLLDVNKKLDSVLMEELDEIDTLKAFKSELDETLDVEKKQVNVLKQLAEKIDKQRQEGRQEIDILQDIREDLNEILEDERGELEMLRKK